MRDRRLGFELVHLLLFVTVVELALNRLAVPALRPPGDTEPPTWHTALDHIGLFFLYFASTLAALVLVHELWRHLARREIYWPFLRRLLAASGAAFLAIALVAIADKPSEGMSFAFESTHVVFLLVLVIAQVTERGDLGAKIGLAMLAAPIVIHYYGPLAVHYLEGPEAMWSDLPDRVQARGQWAMVFAALLSPYCFAPRPFVRSATRITPLIVGVFVGVLGAVVLRKHYEVGMLLASRGLGIDLGPGAPSSFQALYLVALGTVTWTIASCFIAESSARRDIGVGIALVVVGGYGFAWPLQYLVSAVGLVTIGAASSRVVAEERGERERAGVRGPPIADEVWHAYVMAVVAKLRERTDDGQAATLSARGDGGTVTTHIMAQRRGVPVRIRIERENDAIAAIDIVCGSEASRNEPPAWSLYARPEKMLAIGAHPEPPVTSAPAHKTGDETFDRRFRVRDRGGLTEELLDDGLRARATAMVDGWIAYWPGIGLRYRVHPGWGAPLDHPVPVTELAFRGTGAPPAVERIVTLLDFLVESAGRVLDADELAATAIAIPAGAVYASDEDIATADTAAAMPTAVARSSSRAPAALPRTYRIKHSGLYAGLPISCGLTFVTGGLVRGEVLGPIVGGLAIVLGVIVYFRPIAIVTHNEIRILNALGMTMKQIVFEPSELSFDGLQVYHHGRKVRGLSPFAADRRELEAFREDALRLGASTR